MTMNAISVIVITKNEAANIAACIASARLVSDDIIVIDSGSTDETIELATQAKAKIIKIEWKGFGDARNTGASHAAHDWILAIDADERVIPALVAAIKNIADDNPSVIYGFKRQNYFLGKKIRFGEWGKDKVYRFYNRNQVSWDRSPIHENLVGDHTVKKIINGSVEHYPVIRPEQNTEKTIRYATLNAQKFFQQGKKASFEKRFLSPVFNFVKCYFLLLGILDGKQGYVISKTTSYYVWLKYDLLHKLYAQRGKR
jgi:glycosyltransferase involved in cell wall biosynthesis